MKKDEIEAEANEYSLKIVPSSLGNAIGTTRTKVRNDVKAAYIAGRSKGQESEEALKQEIEAWKTAHKEASEHFMEMAADYRKCEKEMEAKDRRIKELERVLNNLLRACTEHSFDSSWESYKQAKQLLNT